MSNYNNEEVDFLKAVEDYAVDNDISISNPNEQKIQPEDTNKKEVVYTNPGSDTTTKQKPLSSVIRKIIDSSHVNSMVIEQISDLYVVAGKTLKEWDKIFTIKIPRTFNSSEHEQLIQNLNHLQHIATLHLAHASISIEALTGEEKTIYSNALIQIRGQLAETKQRMPGVEVLKSLSEEHTTDVRDSLTYAKNYKQLFTIFLDRIKFNEKLLEQITINRGYELKLNR